jgi:hypothetical protein
MMKIFGQDNMELMQITSLEREDGKLVMKGKVFGSGRATAIKMCEDLKINFDKIGQKR